MFAFYIRRMSERQPLIELWKVENERFMLRLIGLRFMNSQTTRNDSQVGEFLRVKILFIFRPKKLASRDTKIKFERDKFEMK